VSEKNTKAIRLLAWKWMLEMMALQIVLGDMRSAPDQSLPSLLQ
jgi:hypothetical protein